VPGAHRGHPVVREIHREDQPLVDVPPHGLEGVAAEARHQDGERRPSVVAPDQARPTSRGSRPRAAAGRACGGRSGGRPDRRRRPRRTRGRPPRCAPGPGCAPG
jgi:hypothetical protein